MSDDDRFLRTLFQRAVEAAQPGRWLAEFLPRAPSGRTVVVGAGKAAAGMAEAVERVRGASVDGAVAVPGGTGCGPKGSTFRSSIVASGNSEKF